MPEIVQLVERFAIWQMKPSSNTLDPKVKILPAVRQPYTAATFLCFQFPRKVLLIREVDENSNPTKALILQPYCILLIHYLLNLTLTTTQALHWLRYETKNKLKKHLLIFYISNAQTIQMPQRPFTLEPMIRG